MNFPHYQRGLGVAGWIFMILLFGGVLTVGTKLFPYYMDHNTMSGVLDGVAAMDGVATKRTDRIRDLIKQRFKLNNIRDFPIEDEIEIKRTANGVDIVMDYEARVPLVYNVDLVASFHKQVALRD